MRRNRIRWIVPDYRIYDEAREILNQLRHAQYTRNRPEQERLKEQLRTLPGFPHRQLSDPVRDLVHIEVAKSRLVTHWRHPR